MDDADEAIVYFDSDTVGEKIDRRLVESVFGSRCVVVTDKTELLAMLAAVRLENANFLFMTSGNFSGIRIRDLSKKMVGDNPVF